MSLKNTRFPEIRCWELLNSFFEEESLAKAAERLDLDLSAASRLISKLEQYVDEPLLNRCRRPVEPTSAAERLRPAVAALLKAKALVDDEIAALKGPKPARRFRLSVPSNFSDGAKFSAIHAYAEANPELAFELFSYRDEFDVADGVVDAAYIPYWPRTAPDIEAIPVFRSGSFLLATPGYLNRNGSPERIEDLCRHRLLRRIGRGYPTARYLFNNQQFFDLETGKLDKLAHADFRTPRSMPPAQFGPYPSCARILSGDAISCYQSTLAGEGIAVDLSLRLVDDDLRQGRLVPVLAPWRPALWTNTLAVRAEIAHSDEVQAFTAWFVRKESEAGLARWAYWRDKFGEDNGLAERRGF